LARSLPSTWSRTGASRPLSGRSSSTQCGFGRKRTSPAKAAGRAFFAFVKFYFFKKGFLYGHEGLMISVTNANSVYYKYSKLYERDRERRERDETAH
jgi:hypothetical protein